MSATKGIVASGHPETSAAGRALLDAGGNAFDAALGALCAATVCEPLLTSLAGGGYLMARPAGGEPILFDFFVQTPGRPRPEAELDFHPILADFGAASQEFHVGLGAAAVPGVAAGLFDVHEALGSLPLDVVVGPAVALARQGVETTAYQAWISDILRPILALSPETLALVTDEPGATAPAPAGQRVRRPDLADTLEALVREGRDWFYQGEPARQLLADCADRGGQLSADDLAAYRVLRRVPLHTAGFGAEFWFNPPPSPGGSLVAFALALLEPLRAGPDGSAGNRTVQNLAVVSAMDAANRLRARSPDRLFDGGGAQDLLAESQLEAWRALARPQDLFSRGTTHLSVADEHGNLAAITTSNGEGCGYVIPGTGVMVNNMLGEEDLNPGGFHRWTPGTRLASMMCPTLARLPNGDEIALGTGGSNRIRSAVLQVLLKLCAQRLPLEAAIDAPRLHLEGERLSVEGGFDASVVSALRSHWPDLHEWPERNLFFGGVNAVTRGPDGRFHGVGDPRRGGAVA